MVQNPVGDDCVELLIAKRERLDIGDLSVEPPSLSKLHHARRRVHDEEGSSEFLLRPLRKIPEPATHLEDTRGAHLAESFDRKVFGGYALNEI